MFLRFASARQVSKLRRKSGPRSHLEAVDERLEVVGRLERDLVERVDVDLLAATDAFSDELRDDLVPKRLEGQ